MNKKWTYIILSAFFLLLFSIQFVQYADYDLWWHLSLGQSVYDSGQIYELDEFSYTYAGQPQYKSDWLADLVLYIASLFGGLLGLNIMKAAVIAATFMFIYRMLGNYAGRDRPGFIATVLVMILALLAIRFRLFIRPYIFGYMFFSYFLYALSCFEVKGLKKPLYWLPPLQIIWANMSVSSLFGPIAAIFFLAGALARKESRKHVPFLGALSGILLLCSLVSPEFYMPYVQLFSISDDVINSGIGEFQPLSLSLLFGYGFKYTFAYQGLVLLSFCYFILMKGWKNIYHVLLFATFMMESVLYVRMIDFFALVAVIAAVPPLKWAISRLLDKRVLNAYAPVAITALILAIAPIAVFADPTYTPGTGVKDNVFPDEALAFLDREGVSGKMFNSYSFGGYIIHHAPERKVFIDGRQARLYGHLENTYRAAINNASIFSSLDEKWDFDYALLEYDIISRKFPLHLNDNQAWALVFWDRSSVVYLKRNERNREIIEKYEFIFAKPSFYSFDNVISFWKKWGLDPKAIPIMDREISMSPLNQEMRISKASYLHQLGPAYYPEAFREVQAALAMEPDVAIEHSFAAVFLGLKGRGPESRAEIEKALKLDPAEPIALGMKQTLDKGKP